MIMLKETWKVSLTNLMSLPDKPNALFTATDQITMKCVALLAESAYQVPADLALIGFSNTDMADAFNPSLDHGLSTSL